ncbi:MULTISPECIES: arsenate reductase family protein [Flavobacterium]|uniref:Arsenate reductase family protein n=1 Tax=Flavobacterium sedimenticola TaxID=3043286 RepID=A0ABT6XTJ8_9FLAO|nr:arsenate reductase family protein [Flavobacterium sedimenticola]MDI9258426.1 arsenate reductase family protein [Flavobacterium sedimenticola]
MLQILHNPRCGKSRTCLAFLDDNTIAYEIRNYIENPLTKEEIKILLQKLDMKPIELVRVNETVWVENYKGKKLTNTAIINAMVKFPILIQRPIIVQDNRAFIGREPETLEKILEK